MSFIEQGIKFYYGPPVRAILRNAVYCLDRELRDCQSVLDLGCGYNSPLQYLRTRFCVGVELFLPYIKASQARHIHKSYLRADIRNVEFKEKSFDAVMLSSVIEHLEKKEALKLLDKAASIARKKVILITPNGYLRQDVADGNQLQAHLSGWQPGELAALGFRAFGLNGFKIFREDFHLADTHEPLKALLSTVRFKPRLLWLAISELSQIIAYYFPAYAFEVFYVKKITT